MLHDLTHCFKYI